MLEHSIALCERRIKEAKSNISFYTEQKRRLESQAGGQIELPLVSPRRFLDSLIQSVQKGTA